MELKSYISAASSGQELSVSSSHLNDDQDTVLSGFSSTPSGLELISLPSESFANSSVATQNKRARGELIAT